MADAEPSPDDPILGLQHVADRAKVHYQTALRWVNSGALPAIKLAGNRWRVKRSDLDAFMAGELS